MNKSQREQHKQNVKEAQARHQAYNKEHPEEVAER